MRQKEQIVLQLRDDVGGARRALQRALGRGVEIGNTQIRFELDGLSDGWEQPLVDTVQKLADFRERVIAAGVA